MADMLDIFDNPLSDEDEAAEQEVFPGMQYDNDTLAAILDEADAETDRLLEKARGK